MTLLEPDRQLNGIQHSLSHLDIVSPRRLDTEEKRIEFLQDMLDTMKKNTGTFNGPPGFLDILSESLCDNLPTSRCLALDVLCGIIPGYVGNHLDMLFPQLLQNLLHHHTTVKKATLQVLHLYFKYSQDKSVILDFLIKYGIKSENKTLRNEVFLTMPALVRSGFTQKQLENLFISILGAAFSIGNGESSLPIVLCLEHIKDEMGDARFSVYFTSLDKNLRNLYKKVIKHCLSLHHESSKSDSPRTSEASQSQLSSKEPCDNKDKDNVTDDSIPGDNLVFGFVPKWIISKLDNGDSWQERSDVINEFLAVVSTHVNDDAMKENCGELLKYVCPLIEDLNFNVALTSLTILHKVIVKVGPAIKFHLDLILKALLKKLNDPKLVVKKINLRIALSLMHSVTPTVYLRNILPLLKHKNARIREEIINMVTAALLSFPSSYFDLTVMASQFSFALLDSKRRVRHASLECLAILAQKLGPGKLSPLVSAIDKIENEEGGKGVLAAVQARLSRRILPRINEEGYVQYALTIPTNVLQVDNIALDVAWVIAGSSSGTDPARQLVPEKRYFSAGKKKLPWQADETVESPTRKDVGSAPSRKASARKGLQVDESVSDVTVPVVRESWVSDSLLVNKQSRASFHKKKLLSTSPKSLESTNDPDLPHLQKDVSYFEIYKNKMKKLKAAGLQADAQMINSINPNMAFRNSLNNDVDQKYLKDMTIKKVSTPHQSERSNSNDILSPLSVEQINSASPTSPSMESPTSTTEHEHTQYTPIPLKPTLARSASKKKLRSRMDEKKQESSNQSNDSYPPTQSNVKAKQEKQRSAPGGGNSPFPLRPTIHRTPSGRMNTKPVIGTNGDVQGSNLKDMSEYSFSSPNLGRHGHNADDEKPLVRKDSLSPTSKSPSPRIKDIPFGNIIKNSLTNSKSKNNKKNSIKGTLNDDLIDDDENPDAPKLAKSAQEKLRKLKEERLRYSVDAGNLMNKKENRLSRSLDFQNVGLIEFQTNGKDEYTENNIYNDSPKKYLSKSKHSNRSLRGKQKPKVEKHNDTADHTYDSIHISGDCIIKPKDSTDGTLHKERSLHKAKELKEYNERLQLDTTWKSHDAPSEHSMSSNTTYQVHSSVAGSISGNSTSASLTSDVNSVNKSPTRKTSGNSTPVGGSPQNKGSITPRSSTPVRTSRTPTPVMSPRSSTPVNTSRSSTPVNNTTYTSNRSSTPVNTSPHSTTSVPMSPRKRTPVNTTPRSTTPVNSHNASPMTSPRHTSQSKDEVKEVNGGPISNSITENTSDMKESEEIKYSRNMEKKRKSRKVKRSDDANNDLDTSNDGKGRRPDRHPIAGSSPMCRRKNLSSVDTNNNNVEPLVSSNSFNNDLYKELPNPQQSSSTILDSLRSDEWESKCDGLFTLRRLVLFHPEYLNQDFHIVLEAVLNEVKNLRSQVTRAALGCIADIFACVPKLIEPDLELILNTILLKASDTNHFIRIDVEEALKKLVENAHSQKAMAAIIATGIHHRNAIIRKVFAKYLADLSEQLGSSQLRPTHKDIVAVAAKLSVDPQPDARYHGRRILFLLLDEPDLDRILIKDVPSSNLRPVQDVVENLKNKGLGDPPTESAKRSSRNGFISYRGSEVIKTARGSEIIKNTNQSPMKDGDVENGSKHEGVDTGTPEKQRRKPSNKDLHLQALNLDCLKKLESSNWSDRYEGLDDVYDIVSTKPNEASANIMKIFDKFCPRLADPNSKVNLYALQTLNRCIPILRNSMSSATTLVVENLKASLASKNEAIYLAAKDSLNTLVKYVDNVYLIQPLCTTVQYSNVRNKPEFAECLADIISPVYKKKPNLVNRLVLPLLWNFLSTANSGVSQTGRANLQHAMGRICKTLYECLGKELLVEAETKGVRASQKLEIFLQ